MNRLTAVTSGTHRTEFTYNGLSQRVKIVEKDNGSVTITKQFVWIPGDTQPSEERDGSNAVTKRFYAQGERIGGASYYYTKDHLGSTWEMTDGSGAIHARYGYDPYGRLTKISGDLDSDFTYAGYYNHSPSGLYATLYRLYDPDLGRWISRDPVGERGGPNLYEYVLNDSINLVDLFGLLSRGAQNIVDSALAQSGGDAYQAWLKVKSQRDDDPKCPELRDAEHFLFADYFTQRFGLLGGFAMDIDIPIYTGFKALVGATGGLPSTTSDPSWSEIAAGYEGVGEGVYQNYKETP